MTDLIDRQAAIDDLKCKDPSQIWDTADVEVWVNTLPSAFPCPEGFDPEHPTEQDKKDILEALEQVRKTIDCTIADIPDTNVGDVISRQAAIDYFVTNVGFHDEDGYSIDDSDELRKIWTEYFDGIPSAQPETPPYVAEIESEYKKWVSMPYINKPLAKALYEVWKKHDREDVSRNG